MFDEIEEFVEENGGVLTVSELATLTDENESAVRRWARENDVRRCGSTFVFSAEKALEFADDLVGSGDDDGDDPEDDGDDREDDDGDREDDDGDREDDDGDREDDDGDDDDPA